MTRIDVEIRTRSVPAAGHLICLGFEPLGVMVRNGEPLIRFAPAASEAMDNYLVAKRRVDAMLDAAESRR
jgi:hypothetical protein